MDKDEMDTDEMDKDTAEGVAAGTERIVARANLAVRLGVELAAYGSLCLWGASLTASPVVNISFAVAAPLAAILLWARYLAPKARRALHDPAALVVEVMVFAVAALALAGSGRADLAAAFATVAAVNTFLLRVLGQHRLDLAS